jgi:DNA mismatch endonuclease (patch repair protein)
MRYRIHVRSVFGNPDIAIVRLKLAVFVDSEFWHGHNWTHRKHEFKTNREFWFAKIERNIQRDQEVNRYLNAHGWTVLRYWGRHVVRYTDEVADEILTTYQKLRDESQVNNVQFASGQARYGESPFFEEWG